MPFATRIRNFFAPLASIRFADINWKRSALVVLICGAVIWDIVSGGKVQRQLVNVQKYGKAAIALVVGLGVLLMVNKPGNSKADMMQTASDIVSVMPASATTRLMKGGIGFMSQTGGSSINSWTGQPTPLNRAAPNERRTKARSVSEARKKAVAATQGWKCSACNNVLSATYEVDHIIELQDGGSNEVENLTAMCRNCHGDKTLRERLSR
jgi:5-methylcytosine-specific restriction protein A